MALVDPGPGGGRVPVTTRNGHTRPAEHPGRSHLDNVGGSIMAVARSADGSGNPPPRRTTPKPMGSEAPPAAGVATAAPPAPPPPQQQQMPRPLTGPAVGLRLDD